MEEWLNGVLAPEEKVLWTGKPEAFETLDAAHKKPFVTRTVLAATIAALLIGVYIVALRQGAIQWGVILVVLALACIGPVNMLTDADKMRKIRYAATDRRLIVFVDSANSVDYDKITEAAFRCDRAGHVSLLCGKGALRAKEHKWRGYTWVVPEYSDEQKTRCDRFALYAVDDVEGLRAVLREKIPSVL
ncbi:MAG: hypothetical protein IJ179_02735 [Oscillospiraceae bacterium]|nr:hypothetical protein [Oscillospiraceae bacterium]